jgi:hypothetical protein
MAEKDNSPIFLVAPLAAESRLRPSDALGRLSACTPWRFSSVSGRLEDRLGARVFRLWPDAAGVAMLRVHYASCARQTTA